MFGYLKKNFWDNLSEEDKYGTSGLFLAAVVALVFFFIAMFFGG